MAVISMKACWKRCTSAIRHAAGTPSGAVRHHERNGITSSTFKPSAKSRKPTCLWELGHGGQEHLLWAPNGQNPLSGGQATCSVNKRWLGGILHAIKSRVDRLNEIDRMHESFSWCAAQKWSTSCASAKLDNNLGGIRSMKACPPPCCGGPQLRKLSPSPKRGR